MLDSLFSKNAVQVGPGLRVWTDDPHRHHEVKPGTTIIPLADKHGRVESFDPSRPGPFVLHAPGQEPVFIDPTKADMTKVKDVSVKAAALSSDAGSAFRRIGEGVSAVVAPASPDTAQFQEAKAPVYEAPPAPDPPRLVPGPAAYRPAAPPAPAPNAPALPAAGGAPPFAPAPYAPAPAPTYPPAFPNVDPAELAYLLNFFKTHQAPASPQVARPWDQEKPAAQAAPSGLGLPFVGPQGEPARPSVDVTVALPSMGSLRVRFHEVVDHPDAVVFVYDTRYPDGTQWAPPADFEQVFVVECPSRSVRAKVRGGSINFRLGPLELTVMVKESPDV